MKIAFYVYPTAFQNPGGGEVQLLKTKEYLEKRGVTIKLFDIWNDRLHDFDILHVFGSVKDALPMMEEAKRARVKTVLSTICWYSWKSAWGTYGFWKTRSAAVLRHAVKVIFPFVSSDRKRMIEMADILMPNSEMESRQLCRYFLVSNKKICVVPNGVDPVFAAARPDAFVAKYALKKFVLCVGRIEPRKNQLSMIRALKGTDVPLVIIGDPVSHYQRYYETCRREASSQTLFLGGMPHGSELLISAYAACDTFLLPTWFETPGLAALEAGLAGAKIVITEEGATREYFRDFATYVNPSSESDIRRKTLATFEQKKGLQLKEHILKYFQWTEVAEQVLAAYRRLLQS